MSELALREAMLASRSTAASYWRYSLYKNVDGISPTVHYCTSKETTERIAQYFLDKEIIGFDIEWKPKARIEDGIRKNVSLIQLACEERIALFHIALYAKGTSLDDLVAPTLKKVMESSKISKVGVAIKSDCTRLRKFMQIESQGLFELSHLYKLVAYSSDGNVDKIDKRLVSLATQAEAHLQLPLFKGDVRCSDWSTKLSDQQLRYAASDSYAGYKLFDVMEGKRKALCPTPPRPEHAELNLPIKLANGQTVETEDEQDDGSKEPNIVDYQPPDVEQTVEGLVDFVIEDGVKSRVSHSTAKDVTTLEIEVTQPAKMSKVGQTPPVQDNA